MAPRKVTYSRRPTHAARAAHARGERQFRTYDTSAIRPRRSKVPYIVAAVIAVIVIGAIIAFAVNSCGEERNANLVADGETVTVQIAEGSTVSDITETLWDAGLIEYRSGFTSAVNSQNAASSLQAGVYELTGGMSYDEIVSALVEGPSSNSASLTVTEGATISTVAEAVEEAYDGSITADQFIEACNNAEAYVDDYSFVSEAYSGSLEGFLFPKTYDLIVDATAEDVVRQMLAQYETEVASLDYSYPESIGLSQYETLILASIVQKEGTSDIYTRVAAVFYNRLTTEGDPSYGHLGSDATTAYEVGEEGLESYDWTTDSLYNTRVVVGLCPTPICSPSLEALQAVCDPESDFSDYYFFSFWTNDEGGVDYYFDKTYEEHQATIAEHS